MNRNKPTTFCPRIRKTKTTTQDLSSRCHICETPITKYSNISYGTPANKSMFCSEICKAKSCIAILENGCWMPRVMVFTSNGRSYSVRAVIYERVFNVRYIVQASPPSCGNKSCANPIHMNFKSIDKPIRLEDI